MDILQISAYCGPQGGNYIASMEKLESKMADIGYNTIYVFPEVVHDYEWCKNICKRTKVYFLPVKKARIKMETYFQLKTIFKENKIKFIHSHFELYDIPIKFTAPKNIKIFWHLHDPIADGYSKAFFTRKLLIKLQYKIFSKNVKLITCSKKHGDFAKKLGFLTKNIYYVPNGLDCEKIKRVKKNRNKREFLMFCWDYYRKGGDIAIKAADNIYLKRSDFSLQFIPDNIPIERKYLIKHKPVRDINTLFKDTGAFLHLSRSEGLSYALLEAVYSGLPVICSDIPENLPVKDCPTVKFIKNENVFEVIKQMMILLDSNFYLSKEDVDTSRNFIEKFFSIDSWVNNIMEIYFME